MILQESFSSLLPLLLLFSYSSFHSSSSSSLTHPPTPPPPLLFSLSGVTFTESWNTASELNAELNYEPKKWVDGLKLTLDSTWVPTSG